MRADSTLPSTSPVDSFLGRVLDEKYRLDARLGEGGMGTVYRATHLLIERPVAVKVLNSRLVTDEAARERFRREARAAGRLRHTNAVAVTDFGETSDGLVYIVMELLEGRSLREMLAAEAPLEAARAVSLMLQTSAAVGAAHEEGIIHRDLKPGNIFVVQRPSVPHIVKVLDFGIAKLATDATDGGSPITLTEAGVMIGTPRYMSPEQCDGAPLTPASDVYSLGVILYEMLTGEPPFTGATPLSVALKHSAEAPRPPREINQNIPPEIEEVVLHALEKKPADRPPDAGALRRELYAVSERLGLGHSAGFSAPTLETLRDAGTETPSGRLVIDIERLRQSRANTAPITTSEVVLSDTAESEVVQTGGKPSPSSPSGLSSVDGPASAASGRASRLRVPIRSGAQTSWSALLQQSPARSLTLALVALVVVVALLLALASSGRRDGSSTKSDEADEAVGRTLTPVEQSARTTSLKSEPRAAAEFYERGRNHFSSRNYDAAIRDFRRALELQPDFPSAHNRLGRALMVQGQLGAAADEFREAVRKRNGDYPAALYNLGYALQLQGTRDDEATEAYNDAIRTSGGTYPDAFYQLGIIHLKRKQNEEAADAMRKAIEQNGGHDADAHFGLGTALARQEKYSEAEEAFRAAIEERGGEFPDAHFNLGLLYQNTNRWQDAIREFEIYLEQRPGGENQRLVENSLRYLRRRAAEEGNKQ